MTTHESAVEVLARYWFDRQQSQRMDAGRLDILTGKPWQWDDVTEDDKRGYRAIFEPLAAALDAAGLLATGEELFAIRWDVEVAGLHNISPPMPDRDRVEASLANSAFGGTVVSRRHTEWREVTP